MKILLTKKQLQRRKSSAKKPLKKPKKRGEKSIKI
jgi:hypothetical protein